MRLTIRLLLCVILFASTAAAYDIDGSKWPGGETVFYTALEGVSKRLVPWNSAVLSALEEWNSKTDFNFVVREEYRNPCLNDLLNSIDFTSTVCGSSFGSGTIAVTLRDFQQSVLGPDEIVSADVVINEGNNYDIFDGPLSTFQLGSIANPIDLRRVILHELGHVIGLGHDNQVDAIMNSTVGSIDRLQPDDIEGANALYGGLNNCVVQRVYFGSVSDSLANGDCTVRDLMAGGTDLSFIDVRRLELQEPANLTLEMRSASLDSVILLADDKLRILALDDNGGGGCDARLSRNLSAGTYYVLSNTYDTASNCAAVQGPYQLSLTFSATDQSDLRGGGSLQGGQAEAGFFGGISADNGRTFGNRFRSTQSLDISGRILVDPRHQGQAGFLVMGALLDGQFLLRNQQGQWLPFDPARDPLILAAEKTLQPVESFMLVENLVTRDLDIEQVVVDFYFGYGLVGEPGELYFHQYPINLIIEP